MLEHTNREMGGLEGRDRVIPTDTWRGSNFGTGTINSGATVSGGGTDIRVVSSPSRIRVLNLELFNNENGWIEIEFRDGHFGGGRVLGPYRLNAFSERRVTKEELEGRFFTSSIHGIALSGYNSTPLSNGVQVNVSFALEPTDIPGI